MVDLYSRSSPVKSIQRGVTRATSTADVAVLIAPVDPNKCFVILGQGEIAYNTSTNLSHLITLSRNVMRISSHATGGRYPEVSWQIIEFH